MLPVAQLVRASGCEPEDCGFKSRQAPYTKMAELADAPASGAGVPSGAWEFDSPSSYNRCSCPLIAYVIQLWLGQGAEFIIVRDAMTQHKRAQRRKA
jgi:hypothetical protein